VLKPAEQTPASILVVVELIQDLLPAGVLNIVSGTGVEVGEPLATSPRIAKIAFTGSTVVGQKIMEYATQNIIPVTLELGGKSPNIFFKDVMDADDAFFDKALEGFAMFALNQGEVCTCPSHALIHEDIYDAFIAFRPGDGSLFYMYPPPAALLLAPFGLLAFTPAFVLFQVLSHALLWGFWALWIRRWPEQERLEKARDIVRDLL